MRRKGLLPVAISLLLGLSLTGCADNGDSSSDPKDTKPAAESEELVIGYSFPTKNNEFWANALKEAERAAEQLGVKLMAEDANNKQEEQVADVENLIASGIDGLVLGPQDASVVPGILASAKAKNIPVMIIDRLPTDDVQAGVDYLAFIGPNDEEAGYQIANSLISAGAKQLVAIGGYDGTSVAEGRKKGLNRAIDENPDVKLLQYVAAGENMDDGTQAMSNLLQSQPDLDGVWCYNDSLALASVDTLKAQGKIPDVKVGGMDLLDPAIKSMQAKELWFSTGGHYMQSAFALVMVYDALNDVKPSDTMIQLNLLAVSQDNLDKFVTKYIDNPNPVDYTEYAKSKNPDADAYFNLSLD